MKNFVIIFAVFIASAANAQKPLQFTFSAGIVSATPSLQNSANVVNLMAVKGISNFDEFAEAADYQTSILNPQFSIGLRVNPLRRIPIYAYADAFTSPFIAAEISFKVGTGIYFRKYIKPTIRRKRKYGFYTEFGVEYAMMYDKGFNQDAYMKSIGNEDARREMKEILGVFPKPSFNSDVVCSQISFGHISERQTELGVQLKYSYDYNATISGSLSQFQLTLYSRF